MSGISVTKFGEEDKLQSSCKVFLGSETMRHNFLLSTSLKLFVVCQHRKVKEVQTRKKEQSITPIKVKHNMGSYSAKEQKFSLLRFRFWKKNKKN
jgi:hypothetical protein